MPNTQASQARPEPRAESELNAEAVYRLFSVDLDRLQGGSRTTETGAQSGRPRPHSAPLRPAASIPEVAAGRWKASLVSEIRSGRACGAVTMPVSF